MDQHDHRRVRPPAPGHRPGRDAGVARLARRGGRRPGQDPRPVPAVQAARAGPRAARSARPPTVSTPYVNTIPPDEQPWFPGDEDIERRIRAFIRWNAAVMVVKANKHADGIGGHLSTFASSAALYEVGFNHFFRGKDDGLPGDHIYFQGHAAPGIYARAFLEGRLDEDQLDHFRREIGGDGPVVVPAPAAHARLLGVPHGVDGPRPDQLDLPGPLQPLPPQPPHRRHQRVAGVVLPRRRRVRRARDARLDLARRPRAARQPHLGRQLQPAAPRRPGARQRQDHPGARGRVPRRRLERHQGHLGLEVGRAARRATSTACCSTR